MTANSDKKGAAQAAPTLAELAEQIKNLNEQEDRSELAHALEVGALLIQAKTKVPRGHWETWVREKLAMPRQRSARCMRLAANVSAVIHCKTVVEADALLRRPSKRTQHSAPKRKPREAGKRLRDLHSRKTDADSRLFNARISIMKMVGILEGIDLPEYGVRNADDDTIAEIHQELTILATWVDQSLDVVGAEMNDLKMMEQIRKLREDTNGRSPAEIATARRLADKLELKRRTKTAIAS